MSRVGAWINEQQQGVWRVWAPAAERVDLILSDATSARTAVHPLVAEPGGTHHLCLDDIEEGQRYAFSIDGRDPRPDPASRHQPDGVHRPSAVWCPEAYHWYDADWRGVLQADLVIYELHVGTFTPEGTFAAVIPRLSDLRALGITAIEIMPVGQFPGNFGWGYDGVHWFAVQESYGGPRGLQALVDACHQAGLAVILDVVYNHLGPEGNYLAEFGPYFTGSHGTPWGAAVNYDRPGSEAVRAFVLQNVEQWIRDFHVDGLRLDAVQEIYDDGPTHILADIAQTAERLSHERGLPVHVIAETDQSDVHIVTPIAEGGFGIDAIWNDDFHHSVHCLLTGERAGYYRDFPEPVSQLAKALNRAFVYDGQFSEVRNRVHGTSADGVSSERFVVSIQTHDQVGNRALGERLHQLVSPEAQRLAAGLLLLSPFTPMLFMGEEYGEQRPFLFFCDFEDTHLRTAVREGRRQEFADFDWGHNIPDPTAQATRDAAVLAWNWSTDPAAAGLRRLYGDLLRCRRELPALRDRRHRQAELRETSAGTPLLVQTRGEPESPGLQVLAVYHLGQVAGACEVPELASRQVLLRSLSPEYGGRADAAASPLTDWQPYEFRLYDVRR